MLNNEDLRTAAIEKHQALIQQAGEARTERKDQIARRQPLLAKIGRLLIHIGQQMETQATTRQAQNTQHVTET